ncbi:hypothetical protein H4R33_002478 [Dimargaris cristalligena]|nr:hypothetical protein H4R33_002478 [Dimargaris cristalligena]
MSVQDAFQLANRRWIPAVGLGTWRMTKSQVSTSVQYALESGYRHFDTASAFGTAHILGDTLARFDIPREPLFLSYKLWPTEYRRHHVRPAVEKMLQDLQVDYLDAVLLHFPVAFHTGAGGKLTIDRTHDIGETWSELETFVTEGRIRSLGVSNFSIADLNHLQSRGGKIAPVLNQVELHPFHPQWELLEYCRNHGIHMIAASPLGGTAGKALRNDPTINRIAQAHNKTVAQVLLSWAIKRGTSVVPRSTDPQRIASNMKGMSLTDGEMAEINDLEERAQFIDHSKVLGITGL